MDTNIETLRHAEPCPHEDVLAAFIVGDLDNPSFENVAEHVMECESCQEMLETLGKREDTLVRALRQPSPPQNLEPVTQTPLRSFGRYNLLHLVGQGAFGAVYKAHDTKLQRLVAVKTPRGPTMSQYERERFFREARNAAQLAHPGVVPVYDVGEIDGEPFLVSEFVEGETLSAWLADNHPSFRHAAEIVASLADALHYAHQARVIHRDIKPSNMMLAGGGQADSQSTSQVRLMDFGLARREIGEATMTGEGEVLGTPAYMSPEQAAGGSHRADARSDVYSLGVVLYEMLAGERPFRGNARMVLRQVLEEEPKPPRALNDGIPKDLQTICLKAMAKEASKRYPSAAALREDLQRWLTHQPILARPVGNLGRFWRWSRRNPRVAILTVAVACLIFTVAVTAAAGYFFERAQRRRADQGWQAAEENLRRANEENLRAQQNLKLARQATDDWFTTMSQSYLLNAPGLLPLRRRLLTHALDYYEKFVEQHEDDPSIVLELGRAHLRLGLISYELGAKPEAKKSLRAGIDLLSDSELDQRFSPSELAPYRGDLSKGWVLLARIHQEQGDVKQSLQAAKTALEIQTQNADAETDSFRQRHILAIVLTSAGKMQKEAGRVEEGKKLLTQAIDELKHLLLAFPAEPRYQADLGVAYMELGSNRQHAGDLEAAAAAYQNAVTRLAPLQEQSPQVFFYRNSLATAYDGLANTQTKQGDIENAALIYPLSYDLLHELSAANPQAYVYQSNLVRTARQWAVICLLQNDVEQAEELLDTAATICRELIQNDSSNGSHKSELSLIYQGISQLRLRQGDIKQADEAAVEAVQIAADAVNRYGDVPKFTANLASAHHFLGELRLGQRKLPAALEEARQAVKWCQTAAKKAPDQWDFQAQLVESYNILAGRQLLLRQLAAAETYKQAEDACAELVKRPLNQFQTAHVENLSGETAIGRGQLWLLQGRTDQAIPHLEKAVKHFQNALHLPERQLGPSNHARALSTLGHAFQAAGREKDAMAQFRQAAKIYLTLANDYPTKSKFWRDGIKTNYLLGHLAAVNGQWKEAEDSLHSALAMFDTAREQFSRGAQADAHYLLLEPMILLGLVEVQMHYRRPEKAEQFARRAVKAATEVMAPATPANQKNANLLQYQVKLAQTLLMVGDHRQASKIASELSSPVFSAAVLVECIEAAGRDEKLPSEQRKKLADMYREQAAKKLAQAKPAASAANVLEMVTLAVLLATGAEETLRDPKTAVLLAQKTLQACALGHPAQMAPYQSLAHFALGAAKYHQQQWAEAIESLQKSYEFEKRLVSGNLFFLAMAYWKKGDKEEARRWLKTAIERMDALQPIDRNLPRFRQQAAQMIEAEPDDSKEAKRP